MGTWVMITAIWYNAVDRPVGLNKDLPELPNTQCVEFLWHRSTLGGECCGDLDGYRSSHIDRQWPILTSLLLQPAS